MRELSVGYSRGKFFFFGSLLSCCCLQSAYALIIYTWSSVARRTIKCWLVGCCCLYVSISNENQRVNNPIEIDLFVRDFEKLKESNKISESIFLIRNSSEFRFFSWFLIWRHNVNTPVNNNKSNKRNKIRIF